MPHHRPTESERMDRVCTIDVRGHRRAERWVERRRLEWEQRLDRLVAVPDSVTDEPGDR